jgi:tetratricopeptide (TPR) repeat protein
MMPLKMADLLEDGDLIDFGPLPEAINALLQQGVAAYYDDRPTADAVFRRALELGPQHLPVYYCLYKIHTYQRNLDLAREAALGGIREAARQANLPPDWHDWHPDDNDWSARGATRFALYTLKALAFIELRREQVNEARALLDRLALLDPADEVGGSVVDAMARRLEAVAP